MTTRDASLALRFALEVAALGALGYWGAVTGQTPVAKVGMGVGAPLVAALAWGTFGSPNAPRPAPSAVRHGLELAVFGAATVALAHAGHPGAAVAFAAVALLNGVLLHVWGE